jgi:hypothetical protein
VLDEASRLMDAAAASDLSVDEKARLQRLLDQHELLVTTVRGMYLAARLESDAEGSSADATALLDLIGRRQAVRERIKAYAPSLGASLDNGDHAETEALAPSGPIAQLAHCLLRGTTEVRSFPHGDFEGVPEAKLAEQYRWSATGTATIGLEDGHLRVQIPAESTGSVTFAIPVQANTAYRVTVAHWNDPAPLKEAAADDADAVTRGEPPIAPRTRVIFRDAGGKAVTKNQWSGIGAQERVKQWHTLPQFILTPTETKSISFTVFLHYPGTYLLDDVKIEELGHAP